MAGALDSFDSLKEAYNAYITENLSDEEDPDLVEYAKRFDVPIKILRNTAKNNNWSGIRNRAKVKFQREVAKNQDLAIKEAAIDYADTQNKFLKTAVDSINIDLPLIHETLMSRLGTMGNKELVAFYKILVDLRNDLSVRMEKANKEATKDDNVKAVDLTLLTKLGGSQLIDIVQHKNNKPVEYNSDREEIFSALDDEEKQDSN